MSTCLSIGWTDGTLESMPGLELARAFEKGIRILLTFLIEIQDSFENFESTGVILKKVAQI